MMQYCRGDYFVMCPLINPEMHYDYGHIISIHLYPELGPEIDYNYWVERGGTDEFLKCTERYEQSPKHRILLPSGSSIPQCETISTLKQEVIDWLNEYVPDSTDKRRADMPKGWMIYHPDYSIEKTSVSVFFLRRVDAIAFKLAWG